MIFLVHFRHSIDISKCITFIAKSVAHRFAGTGYFFSIKSLPDIDRNQLTNLILWNDRFPSNLDASHSVFLTLSNIGSNINITFIRGDGNLRRINIEFQVTLIHVKRTHRFQIRSQFLFRVLIIFIPPSHPIWCR